MSSSEMPTARAARVAAAAFSRLCTPGIAGSAGSGSSKANSTRRAAPGTGPKPRRHHRDVVLGLQSEEAELRGGVLVEAVVTVEVIRLEVHEDGDTWMEDLHVVELEHADLAHDPGVVGDLTDERAQCATDVPGHLDGTTGRPQDLAEKCRRRGLPVRPGDGEDRIREEPGAELELVPDRDTACSGTRDQGRVGPDSGTLHDQIDPLQQRLLLASEMDFDAVCAEPSRVEIFVPVEPDNGRTEHA